MFSYKCHFSVIYDHDGFQINSRQHNYSIDNFTVLWNRIGNTYN